jgi:hypothetical protein
LKSTDIHDARRSIGADHVKIHCSDRNRVSAFSAR